MSPAFDERRGAVLSRSGMSSRLIALVAVLAGLYVLVHLATITTSRLPWFDDSFFASVAESIVQTGEWKLRVAPLWLDKPVYLYGPVYFGILSGVFAQFDLGLVQTRLPGLLSGFGILAVAFLILRRVDVQAPLAASTVALLGLDPTFHQSIHSGRTDSTALFLILLGFLLLIEAGARRGRASASCHVAAAVCASLGALTTPRPGYLLIPMGLIVLGRWAGRRDRQSGLHVVLWGAVCLALFGTWIVWAFGSVPGMLAYYGEFSDAYASGGLGVRAIHTPLLLPLAILGATVLVVRPRILAHELVFFTLAGILGFYVFVKDKGAFSGLYSFFMIPLAYLALAYLLSRLADAVQDARVARWMPRVVLGALLAFNGAVFAARMTLEIVQRDSRDPAAANALVRELIPPGSKVVGDDKFYFAVKGAQSDFQYVQRGGTVAERVRYHRDVYGLEYLITNESEASELFQAYAREMPLVPVATIRAPPDGALADLLTALARRAGIGTSLTASYEGTVFRRGTERPDTP